MYILYIFMFVSSVVGNIASLQSVAINSQTFQDANACSQAQQTFELNVPHTPSNFSVAYCIPAQTLPPVIVVPNCGQTHPYTCENPRP